MIALILALLIGLALISSGLSRRIRHLIHCNQLPMAGHRPGNLDAEIRFVDRLNGYQFEDYVAWLLTQFGFSQVHQTDKDNDAGLDILAVRHSISYGFQCKHYRKRKVKRQTVKHTSDARHYYHVQHVIIVTNAYFSQLAKRDQKFFNVIFWDRNRLIQLIQRVAGSGYS